MEEKVKVVITRHAVERLLERKPKSYRKVSGEVVANIIDNIVHSGRYIEGKGEGDNCINTRISTRKYTVCCKKKDTLVVTTVMNTKEMGDGYKRVLKFSRELPWKETIVANTPEQIERWIKGWKQR